MYVVEQVEPAVFRVEDDDGRVRRMTRSVLASTIDGYSALCKFQSTKALLGWRAEPRDVAHGPQPGDRVRVLVRPDEWAHGTVDAIGMLSDRPYYKLTYDDGMVVADWLSLPWDFLASPKALPSGMRIRVPLLGDASSSLLAGVRDDNPDCSPLRASSAVVLPAVAEAAPEPALAPGLAETAPASALVPVAQPSESDPMPSDVLRPFACVVDADALRADVLSSTGTSSTLESHFFSEEDAHLARALRLALSYA